MGGGRGQVQTWALRKCKRYARDPPISGWPPRNSVAAAPAATARPRSGFDRLAGKLGGEIGGDEGVAGAGAVAQFDRRRSDAPALLAGIGLAAGRAALDDDQRIMRGEARALDLGIVAAAQYGGLFAVGEERRRAARPSEEALGPDFAQEFGRGGVDADWPSGARAMTLETAARGPGAKNRSRRGE